VYDWSDFISIAIDLVSERQVDSSDNSKPRVNILISRITHGENGFEILLVCGQPYQAWVTPSISLLSVVCLIQRR
jgi:hypothetical protein